MATRNNASDITRFGAGWVFSGSGLYRKLQLMQTGELYIQALSGLVASGEFPVEFDNAPFPQFTPTVPVSGGDFYISSVTDTHIYVTFTAQLAGADKTFPYKVGNWMAYL